MDGLNLPAWRVSNPKSSTKADTAVVFQLKVDLKASKLLSRPSRPLRWAKALFSNMSPQPHWRSMASVHWNLEPRPGRILTCHTCRKFWLIGCQFDNQCRCHNNSPPVPTFFYPQHPHSTFPVIMSSSSSSSAPASVSSSWWPPRLNLSQTVSNLLAFLIGVKPTIHQDMGQLKLNNNKPRNLV